MFDSGSSTHVMPLVVMNRLLGLKVSTSYKNICAMDYLKVKVSSVVVDIQVYIASHPNITSCMDIWLLSYEKHEGCFYSRKNGVDLGNKLQMDLSYATIPTTNKTFFVLNKELMRIYHV